MLRCVLAGVLAATASLPAAAQVQRAFPADALRGELVVVQPPQVRLNGQDARLAPGARIRNERNMLALSGTLLGQPLVVNYTVDGFGAVKDVWVLTAAERAKPWPSTAKQAQSWTFDPATQTWTPP